MKTQPTNAALFVNHAAVSPDRLDAVPAFRSIEDKYHVDIRLTHLGIIVRSRKGMGETLYRAGAYDPSNPVPRKGAARGAEQCAAMRKFAVDFILWASTNLPTREVARLQRGITLGRF